MRCKPSTAEPLDTNKSLALSQLTAHDAALDDIAARRSQPAVKEREASPNAPPLTAPQADLARFAGTTERYGQDMVRFGQDVITVDGLRGPTDADRT